MKRVFDDHGIWNPEAHASGNRVQQAMQPPYHARPVSQGDTISNRYGYAMKAPYEGWVIVDREDDPIRTHNGFAFFSYKAQAEWCVELMRNAFHLGVDSNKRALRDLLDLPHPDDAED